MSENRPAGRKRANEADKKIAQRIRARRIELGFTQQQFAEMIGVTYQQTHKYERGVNRVSAGILAQIAKALDVDVSYFFEEVESTIGIDDKERYRDISALNLAYARLDQTGKDAVRGLAHALAPK